MIPRLIIGMIIFLVVLWIEMVLQTPAEEQEGEKNLFRELFFQNKYVYVIGIALAVIFMTPSVFKTLSLWMLIMEFVAMAIIAYWWHGFKVNEKWVGGGSTGKELVGFVLLDTAFLILALTIAATVKVALLWPVLAFVLSVGLMVIDMLSTKAKYEEISTAWWKIAAGVMAGVMVVACCVQLNSGKKDVSPDTTMPTVADAATSPDKDARFVQEWTKNKGNKIDSEFLPKLLKKANGDKITEDDFEEVLLDDCAHDARILAIVANNLKLKKDVSYGDLLTSDKKYLSEEGEKLYYKVEGALETANLLRTEVDSSGTNTGMNDNSYVVSSEAGVFGDLEGTKVVTSDGKTTFYILDRCANVVYPGGINPPKEIPRGDTDNPSKPKDKDKDKEKDPADDPVNRGNAKKGGGQNRSGNGPGEVQDNDPRTEHPTGSENDNNHGYSNPSTVTPANPPVAESHKTESVTTDSKKMDYKPDPVTNRGPADSKEKPTSSEGDGEFTPSD